MTTLLPDQIDDIVNTTLNLYTKKQWVDISLPNQYYVCKRLFTGEDGKAKIITDGGIQLEWKLQIANQSNFRYTGLFSRDRTGVTNQIITAKTPWCIWTNNWSYDVNEEVFNGEPAQIINEILSREHGMYNNQYDQLENLMFLSPSSSSVDPMPIFGFPFWMQRSATEGFNGGDPSGFSSGAGNVLTSSYSKWKNYTFTWSNYTDDDLFSKWRKATEFCNFQAPHNYASAVPDRPDWEYFTTWNVVNNLTIVRNARNDNLVDLNGVGTALMFKSIPIKWVPVLTNSENLAYDSTDPLYGINWSAFQVVLRKGKETRVDLKSPRQHNVRDIHYDGQHATRCYSRRNLFMAYKS